MVKALYRDLVVMMLGRVKVVAGTRIVHDRVETEKQNLIRLNCMQIFYTFLY